MIKYKWKVVWQRAGSSGMRKLQTDEQLQDMLIPLNTDKLVSFTITRMVK